MDISNLTELFDIQRKLDAEIERKHPSVEGEDRFSKKKLALLVEIGELANEQRTWKFWSKDKKPRSKYQTICRESEATHYYCDNCKKEINLGEVASHAHDCEWLLYPMKGRNLVLEEFVDCIHFLLSIGNFYAEYEPEFCKDYDSSFEVIDDFNNQDIPNQFNSIFRYASKLGGGHNEEFETAIDLANYEMVFLLFIGLGNMLGFTEKQIVDAYMSKNAINHQRQAEGY